MKSIFTTVSTPNHHHANPLANEAQWYSWSSDALCAIEKHIEGLKSLSAPVCVNIKGAEPYETTYNYRLADLTPSLRQLALQLARTLLRVRVGRSLIFFHGMMDTPFRPVILHKCFALIRTGLVNLYRDERSALYSPVKRQHADEGFPLHCDLFLTDRLMLIFNKVAIGAKGKSQFLPVGSLREAIKLSPLMTGETKRQLKDALAKTKGADSFDDLYNLLYAKDNPWVRSLRRMMRNDCLSIKLERGEGYLLNDRYWLHGRTPVGGPVPAGRFYRLTYGKIR